MARKYNSYSEAFENIADAIRRKSNTFSYIPVEEMPTRIKEASPDGFASFGAVTNKSYPGNKTVGIYTGIDSMSIDLQGE